jgi:hypothetical protein
VPVDRPEAPVRDLGLASALLRIEQPKLNGRRREIRTPVLITSEGASTGLCVESLTGVPRTCGFVRILEELGGFDRHKIDYSQNEKKADGLGEIAASAFLSMV